jgi:hypothetical protein
MQLKTAGALALAAIVLAVCYRPLPQGCRWVSPDSGSGSSAKIVLAEPGKYCLGWSIHTRWDFADHRAESPLIEISSSDVDLDLMGHTLGRGRVIVQPGGVGIGFSQGRGGPLKNVTIRNGQLQDFSLALQAALPVPYGRERNLQIHPVIDPSTKTIYYAQRNITLQNIEFRGNTTDILVEDWELPLPKLPASASAQRRGESFRYPELEECMRTGENRCGEPVRMRYCWQIPPNELGEWQNTEQVCTNGGAGDTGVVQPGSSLGIEDRLVNKSTRALLTPKLQVLRVCKGSEKIQHCQP